MGMRVGMEEILGLKHFCSRLGEGLREKVLKNKLNSWVLKKLNRFAL